MLSVLFSDTHGTQVIGVRAEWSGHLAGGLCDSLFVKVSDESKNTSK